MKTFRNEVRNHMIANTSDDIGLRFCTFRNKVQIAFKYHTTNLYDIQYHAREIKQEIYRLIQMSETIKYEIYKIF